MIRRDYLLRMIAEFLELLSRLQSLKKGQRWGEAAGVIDKEFERLVGTGAEAVARLTETELLARIIQGEPTQVVRDKTLMVTVLLKEAGDTAGGEGRLEQSRAYYLKGLHLLLDVLAQGELSDWPDFVPTVEVFLAALGDGQLPLETLARLMQHYERLGDFGKAEDALFEIVEAEPLRPGLLEFGTSFYERVGRHTDRELEEGNLPRRELEAGRGELRRMIEKAER
jgi:Family of unknown function (DUF6483)